jgi:nitrite reductase/ring-hydroxylating ferredoxin subunit
MAGPVEVLRAEDLPPNSVTALQVRGRRVAIVHCESGFYALDDECSHQVGPLDDCVLRYPWHGARFEARIGEVLDGPAARPVRTYPVTVEDGMVTVAVDTAAAAATDPRAARRARLAALRAAARTRTEDHELTTELAQPAADGGPGAERTGSGGRGRVRDRGQWANGYDKPLKDSERIKTRPGRSRRLRAHRHHPRSAGRRLDLGRRSWDPLPLVRLVHAATRGGWVLHAAGRVPNEVAHRGAGGGGGRFSQRFGRDVCDVTDRQLHWTRIEDVPEIWARLGAVSVTTHQTCGDVTRSIIGCPLAGVARDEIIDTTPHLGAVDRRLTGTTEFSNLPRKYKISITGCRVQCTVHEVVDIGPVPHFARRLGAFVPPVQVVDVDAGITGLFCDYGYWSDRQGARLKFLASRLGTGALPAGARTEVPAAMADEAGHGRQVLAAERIGAAVGVRCWSRDGRAMAGVSDTEAVGRPLVPRSADMARTCRASGATLWTSRGLLRPRVATAGCREYQDEPLWPTMRCPFPVDWKPAIDCRYRSVASAERTCFLSSGADSSSSRLSARDWGSIYALHLLSS